MKPKQLAPADDDLDHVYLEQQQQRGTTLEPSKQKKATNTSRVLSLSLSLGDTIEWGNKVSIKREVERIREQVCGLHGQGVEGASALPPRRPSSLLPSSPPSLDSHTAGRNAGVLRRYSRALKRGWRHRPLTTALQHVHGRANRVQPMAFQRLDNMSCRRGPHACGLRGTLT